MTAKQPEASPAELESFARAFSDGGGSCRLQCCCGVTFFYADGGFSWEDGELDDLRIKVINGKAREMEWAIGFLDFDGGRWVSDCDCWKPRAARIIQWMRFHRSYIAEFFRLEKARQVAEASIMPEIDS